MKSQYDDSGCNPTDFPSPRSYHATVYSPYIQSLITCGGSSDFVGSLVSSCIIQNKNGDQIKLPPLPTAISDFAMVSISNKLFVIGGSNRENLMETIKLSDKMLNNWSQQRTPFTVRDHCAVVSNLDDYIIVIGGRDKYDNVS